MRKIRSVHLYLLGAGILFLAGNTRESRGESQLLAAHECSFCHGMHGETNPSMTKAASFDLLCRSCHAPGAGGSTLEADYHHQDDGDAYSKKDGWYYQFEIGCSTCHEHHSNPTNYAGGTNIKLVTTSITANNGIAYDIRFEAISGDFSFCDVDGPNAVWDNICDTCHMGSTQWSISMIQGNKEGAGRHHNEDVSTSSQHHQSGATCTQCHEHRLGFQTG